MAEPALRCGRYTLPLGGKTYVMAIVNITDDSFAGGGFLGDHDEALRQALRFAEEGADIIDVGGESARTETPLVSVAEEIERVVPLIERLAAEIDIPISVDSFKGDVAEAALQAGASIVNDIAGFTMGDGTARAAVKHNAGFVINYTTNPPKVRLPEPPAYDDLVGQHLDVLRERIERARQLGVSEETIIVDPGIAFGKSHDEDLEVLRNLERFRSLGRPLLLAPSRKHVIGAVLADDHGTALPPEERLEGTAAVLALAVAHGVDIVRVHDVREMARVTRMADAIVRGQLGDFAATRESWPWPKRG